MARARTSIPLFTLGYEFILNTQLEIRRRVLARYVGSVALRHNVYRVFKSGLQFGYFM